MRILNRETNQVFDSIEIFLTREEGEELLARMSGLLSNSKTHHIHLDTDEIDGRYERELIVSIYTNNNIEEFDDRSKLLINKGI